MSARPPSVGDAAGVHVSLVLREVTITLGARTLVGPLSATVGPGEVLAVMGESGAGKSSLLAWIAGLLLPPLRGGGQVLVDDGACKRQDLTALPVERRRVGLLFQDDLLFPHMTVLENLLFAIPAGPWATREQAARAVLAQAGLAGMERRWPAQLSGGQRARVSLLRALLAEPRVLLLDEPFARLDVPLRERMRSFTWGLLRERGVPAVLVTHDLADVPAGARVVTLVPLPAAEPGDA
jgi:putative thiamine transport system ATP-binding protein